MLLLKIFYLLDGILASEADELRLLQKHSGCILVLYVSCIFVVVAAHLVFKISLGGAILVDRRAQNASDFVHLLGAGAA